MLFERLLGLNPEAVSLSINDVCAMLGEVSDGALTPEEAATLLVLDPKETSEFFALAEKIPEDDNQATRWLLRVRDVLNLATNGRRVRNASRIKYDGYETPDNIRQRLGLVESTKPRGTTRNR